MTAYWPQEEEIREVSYPLSFKMQVNVHRHLKCFPSKTAKECNEHSFLFYINLYFKAFAPQRHHDDYRFYFRKLTAGAAAGCDKQRGDLDLLGNTNSGDAIIFGIGYQRHNI